MQSSMMIYRSSIIPSKKMPNCKASIIIDHIGEKDTMGNAPMEHFYDELYNRVYNKVIFEHSSFRNCYCLIGYNE